MICAVLEHKEDVLDEWLFKVWTDDLDWCTKCNREQNKLVFDNQTKTTKCTKCGHTKTYPDADWNLFQAKRNITYQHMPGKNYFTNLSVEEIFQKYLRELSHDDWVSWLLHDYMLAKMKQDQPTQTKLLEVAKLVVNKMSYDATAWKKLFERMDAKDPDLVYQVPQTIYEFAQKKIQAMPKEDHHSILQSYVSSLFSIYNYSRWKGDRVTCWITSEVLKLCHLEGSSIDFTKYYSYDPLLENFVTDTQTGKKCEIDFKDSYIEWELGLADSYLGESKALMAVWSAYKALTAKLGLHATWPPAKATKFDKVTVKKVTQLVDNSELYRFYDLAINLNTIDTSKAGFYAGYFIKTVKELLPKVVSFEQDTAKASAYIT